MSRKAKIGGLLGCLRRKSWATTAISTCLVFGQVQLAFAQISNTVTVGGIYRGAPIVSAPSVAEVPVIPPNAAMDVQKTAVLNDVDGTPGLSDGDRIDYEITLTNTGNVTINGITFTDTLVQDSRTLALDAAPLLLSGDDTNSGNLDVDEVWVYRASYTIDQDDIDNGNTIDNVAAFEGTAPVGLITAQDNAEVELNAASSVSIEKVAISSSFARPNQVVEWSVTVTNTGTTTLTNISVIDLAADSIECTLSGDETVATLAPGAFETCEIDYTVQPGDINFSNLSNRASVEATSGSTTVSSSDTASIPREDANLVTTKTVTSGSTTTVVGDVVTYEIVVANNGSAEATQITLADDLPAGLTATANNGSVTAGVYTASTGVWTIPSLPNGSSATLTLQGTVDPGQGGNVITNVISAATSVENDPTDDDDVLIAIFTPEPLPIIAVSDVVPNPIDGALAVPGVINVFSDDTLGGVPVNDTTVIPTQVGTWPTDFTLNPDGSIDVAAGTPSGTYVLEYQICEVADPDNCSTATVTIPVESSLPRLAGTVYLDRNQNSSLDPSDDPLPGYVVQLVQNGVVLRETTTDLNGEYEFTGFDPGEYDIIFLEPGSELGVGIIQSVNIGEGETILNQDQPIDPSGVVYDALSGAPVQGATLTLVSSTGTPLPPQCLLPNQQNQITDTDGDYRFDVIPGADPACPIGKTEYRIEITQPAGYLPLPSSIIAPETGSLDPAICIEDFIPGGACNLSDDQFAPQVTNPSPYYLSFLLGSGDRDVVYNHIPLDPVPSPATSGLTIQKQADQNVVRLGDTISYSINVTNAFANPYTDVYIVDTLPVGTLYTPGSAIVDGVASEPTVNGRILEFGPLTIPASGGFDITLSARVGQQVSASELTNTVQIVDENGIPLTETARATVRVEVEPVFVCSPIIGRVYDDLNRNGYPDDGEPGLPGVRLATVSGLLITTDEFGRYSVPCAEMPDPDTGTNFILKLDTRTLPTGYRITSENPRTIRVTAGKMASLNFGAAISRVVDIELSSTAFVRGRSEPSEALQNGIDRLVQALETEPSVLRLTYFENGEGDQLARRRVEKIEELVRQKLRRSQIGIDLWIETTIRSQ